jgi:hypothetical protein
VPVALREDRSRTPGPGAPRAASWLVVGVVGLVAGGMAWLMEHRSYDVWAAIPVAIGLIVVSVPLLRRAAGIETDRRIATLLWWAFGLKLLAAIPRYIVAFDVYDGQADAAAYSRVGAVLARQFREGMFYADLGRPVQGTGFVEVLTGAIYAITGATTVGGFFVFSWMGFWGLYLFHRGFVRACPHGNHWRYAKLVLLLPSLLFWPSSIGKEAWMCLGLGLVAFAGARLLTGARGGLVLLGCGSLALGMVRPHVAAIVGLAVSLAYLVRRSPEGSSTLAPIGKFIVVLLLGAGMVFAVGQLEQFFGVDAFDTEAVQTTLDEVTRRTGQGGSQFERSSGTDLNPSRFPEAFVGVMFRPFPWQATSLQALLAAAESLFLMGLFATSWRGVLGAIRSAVHVPYVVLCCTYTVLFVYGFSAFTNAGILVRQRVQVLPFVLVLVCLPPIGRLRDRPIPGGIPRATPSGFGAAAGGAVAGVSRLRMPPTKRAE